jgi:hypothetical protein
VSAIGLSRRDIYRPSARYADHALLTTASQIVTNNIFSGPDNIFGVAVSGASAATLSAQKVTADPLPHPARAGVANFTVTGNRADSTARFGGVQTGNCHGISSKVVPTFALYDRDKTAASVDFGVDANCWSVGSFQYLVRALPDHRTRF